MLSIIASFLSNYGKVSFWEPIWASVWVLVGLICLVYISICGFLLIRQKQIIFWPNITMEVEPGITPKASTPKDFGSNYQELWLPVNTRSPVQDPKHQISPQIPPQIPPQSLPKIHSWWLPSANPTAKTLLYLHGNSGNLGNNAGRISRLHGMGFSVLAIDYRGYGLSKGDFPSETSFYADAQTALDYLINQKQIPRSQIFLYGHSLGGAIAIELATHNPELAGVIAESAFTSMIDMAYNGGAYWMFPINLILQHRFNSIKKVPQLSMPLLFMHGNADDIVPAHMSPKLYEAATEPKQLLIIDDANHLNIAEVAEQKYTQAIYQLVERAERQHSFN